ncbi:MAG: 50S ribosomal protein L18 [Firmicutes bacterium]|jgi:large subunit ribosomal protein L18|nr:50S ribosomal protein L18 [Bacillota bacterium]HPU01500.1 50S ribosomal protein L18 [Bacillota bacterium]
MIKIRSRNENRKRRHRRVRMKVSGTAARPRLNVFRSNKHIYAQIIDDQSGHTLAAASSLDRELREVLPHGSDCEAADKVGALLARRALDRGIKKVVFDRGGYRYHGRVKALAEAARREGLDF